ATRVVRVLLIEPARTWRLEELGKASGVSLGHSYNVVKRLEELAWAERDADQRIHLSKPADLLQAWCESDTYRPDRITSYPGPRPRDPEVHGGDRSRSSRRGTPLRLHAQRGRGAPRAEPPAADRPLLSRRRFRAVRAGPRPAPGDRGRRHAPYSPAVRPRRAA